MTPFAITKIQVNNTISVHTANRPSLHNVSVPTAEEALQLGH